MKFTVIWKAVAENRLAALWVDADPADRPAITAAANAIDAKLRVDPHLLGESRPGGRRILFERPLVVTFEVREPDRTASVLTVRHV
jgi:hypothetical protein